VDNLIVSPAILIRRERTLARVHKHRAKKRAEREAVKKAVKEARRVARRAALVASRARRGLPPPGTAASRQKAYRQRRKAKGLDPYSRRELAEMAATKAIEAAKYENRILAGTLETWFAESMDQATAVEYVRRHIFPSQPEAAEKYIQQIWERCRKAKLNLNRWTLRPDGIESARVFRTLTWMQHAGKHLVRSWETARHLSIANLPADSVTREGLMDATEAILGNGEAIRRDMN
jgi:hypothetical protein